MKKRKVLMIFFVNVGPRLSFPNKYISFLSKYIIDKLIDFHFECRKSLSKFSGIRVFFFGTKLFNRKHPNIAGSTKSCK